MRVRILSLVVLLPAFYDCQKVIAQEYWARLVEPELASNFVWTIIDSADVMWFGTEKGISRYYNGQITNNFQPGTDVRSSLHAKDNSLWFGTFGNGAYRYKNGIWDPFTVASTDSGLANDSVLAITQLDSSVLCFGTKGGGISCLKDGRWWQYSRQNGLISDTILALEASKDGSLWAGTLGYGLSRMSDGQWTTYTNAEGLLSDTVPIIHESQDGYIWAGTSAGASRFKHGKWENFTVNHGLVSNYIIAIEETRDDALWLGTFGGGISRFQDGEWLNFTISKNPGLRDSIIYAIGESADGGIWFGTQKGVHRLEPDTTPPSKTMIIEKPPAISGTSTPLFRFSGEDNRTEQAKLRYLWRVSKIGADITFSGETSFTAISPFEEIQDSLESVINGDYKFFVNTKDAWRNVDISGDSSIFKIDTTPPTVTINSFKSEDRIAGSVQIVGNAYDDSPIHDFKSYKLHYGFGEDSSLVDWKDDNLIDLRPNTEVRDDVLAVWNTTGLRNGPYWLRLSAVDALNHGSVVALKVEVVESSVQLNSDRDTTFTAANDSIKLFVPAKALSQDVELIVRSCKNHELSADTLQGASYLGFCIAIKTLKNNREQEYLKFNKPITLDLTYPDLPFTESDEMNLTIFYSPTGEEDTWQRLGGTVKNDSNQITLAVKWTGHFALLKDRLIPHKADILDLEIQPRIFSPKSTRARSYIDISYWLVNASNVTCKIYNTAGRLIAILGENEPRNRGINVEQWNGLDLRQQTCPSGLYVVTVQADGKTEMKTVAVMRDQ